MKIAFTCFEDFSDIDANTSRLIVEQLKYPYQILPVSFNRCDNEITLDADAIIHVGVAASRARITVERYAHNLAHSPIQPDNDGHKPIHQKIMTSAPVALETTIPVALIDQIKNEGLWEWSLSAGSYVCNALYFKSLWQRQQNGTKIIFVHVPYHRTHPDSIEKGIEFLNELATKLQDANL